MVKIKRLITERDYAILDAIKAGMNNKEIIAHILLKEKVIVTDTSIRVSVCKLRKVGHTIYNHRKPQHYELIEGEQNGQGQTTRNKYYRNIEGYPLAEADRRA